MKSHLRPIYGLCACAVGALALTNAHAQTAGDLPANTQLPQQVLPTGAEDAAAPAPATQLRRAAVAPSATDQATRELVRMTSESSEGLAPVKQSDGSVRVYLDDRFMSVVVATPTKDGSTDLSCNTGHNAVTKAERVKEILAGKAPKPESSARAAKPAPQVLEEK